MFRVHRIWRHGVFPFHYFIYQWGLSNGLSFYPKRHHIQNLLKQNVDIPTYHFRVHKTVGVSYSRFMFKVHCIYMNGVHHFHYWDLSLNLLNSLLRDQKKYCMQKLCPWQVDVPTYDFGVHKAIVLTYSRIMFRVHHMQRHGVGYFKYSSPWRELSNSLLTNPNGDQTKRYIPRKLKYQLITLGFTKLSAFHLLGQCLENFILWKSYDPKKFM